jgi:dolichol-phosphate mannosyltransferase
MSIQVDSLAEWVKAGMPNLLSVVMPAHNEKANLDGTIGPLVKALEEAGIKHEILVVNDNSNDGTDAVLEELQGHYPSVRSFRNPPPNGFGFAVRAGLAAFHGDAVAIVMADGSDSPADVVAFYRKLMEGYDCVFGSRFIKGSEVIDYPSHKLVLNRLANNFIKLLFGIRYNDVTNAFKCYRRSVIAGLQPLLSHHFNLTVELPLKAIIRGYSYAVLPNSWRNRKTGFSKLKIREMGSRYLFIVLYCFVERHLSRGDYLAMETKKRDLLRESQ